MSIGVIVLIALGVVAGLVLSISLIILAYRWLVRHGSRRVIAAEAPSEQDSAPLERTPAAAHQRGSVAAGVPQAPRPAPPAPRPALVAVSTTVQEARR